MEKKTHTRRKQKVRESVSYLPPTPPHSRQNHEENSSTEYYGQPGRIIYMVIDFNVGAHIIILF